MEEILRNQGNCFENLEEVKGYLNSLHNDKSQDSIDIEKLVNNICQIGDQLNILQEDFKQVIQMMEEIQNPKAKVDLKYHINNLRVNTKQMTQQFNDITKECLNTLRNNVTTCKSNMQTKAVNTLGLHNKLCSLKKMLIATNHAISNFSIQIGNILHELHTAKRSFSNIGRLLVGKQILSTADIQKVSRMQSKGSALSMKISSLIVKTDSAIKKIETMQKHSVKAQLSASKKVLNKKSKQKENVR